MNRQAPIIGRLVFLAFCLLFVVALSGCDELVEQKQELPDLSVGEGRWDYPYHLVIGGGLSETLSLLTIRAKDDFSLAVDIQLTGSAVSQTIVREDELFALCSLSHSVVVYDLDDLSIDREISLGLGSNPVAMAFYEDRNAFVSNLIDNTITYVDLSPGAGSILDTIALPKDGQLPGGADSEKRYARPGGMVVVGDRVFAALSNLDGGFHAAGPGLVAVIDAKTRTLKTLIELSGRDTGSLFYDASAGELYAISMGDYDNDQGGFVGNGQVEVIDPVAEQVVDTIATGGAPLEMAVSSDKIAYLGNARQGVLLRFDTELREVLEPIDLRDPDDELGLSFVSALAVDGNGLLYVAEFNHDRLFVLDTRDDHRTVGAFTVNDGPDTLSFLR